ncbi:hypothetical protein [Saccharopolyspora shandongensis]|uniref:hypothetical protein n=1 Tax=Saccharopolyspora shandongensis TaxID=418495 RepID=UPI0033DA83AA
MLSREDFAKQCVVTHCERAAHYSAWVCDACVLRVSEQLREIGELWLELDAAPAYGVGDGQPRARGKKRPAPGRLDVIAATDPRSVPYALGPDDVDGDVRSVPGTLRGLAEWITEEFVGVDVLSGVDVGVTDLVRYILIRLPQAACRQWFDELASDVAELHAQMLRLTGRGEAKTSLASCPACGGTLRYVGEKGSVLAVECGTCVRRYSGLELVELGQQKANERQS